MSLGSDLSGDAPACVPHLLARQAARLPDAIAVVCGSERLSYGELLARSSRLAGALTGIGVSRGGRVALLLPRSIDAIVAMLAVVRLGAAFVPLDPGYGRVQLSDIVADCAPACVLACPEQLAALGALPWSAPTYRIAELSDGRPPADAGQATPDDPAYVMYTSGSTGRPKGVVVPHRAIARLVIDPDFVDLGPDQTILQLAPLAFDASTLEIWGSLLNGGRLVIMPQAHPTLDDIGTTIAANGVTTLWLTAGLFHILVEQRLSALSPLRQLLAGGDVLSPTHVATVLRAYPKLRLINGYGPTENTTFTCCHTISLADLDAGSVPIGRPIRGTTVHVLDAALRPVADGEEGQLAAGGAGVALGYLNQPALTAERFVPDPLSLVLGARLYLTGDLVKRRPDGALLFLGRIDRQVKINGHRVEVAEIELAMRRHPGVRDAAALLREDVPGRKRLIGYVTGSDDDLLTHLRATLPEWSVPAAVVLLPAMPLTVNGKLDRARLPAPAEAAPRLAPRDATEQALAAIWRRVLGLASVGRDDNFFDLGGTSLQLMEAQAEIQRLLKPQIALLDLFRFPKISEFAAHIDPTPSAFTAPPAPAVDRARMAAAAMQRARAARSA